MTNPFVAAAMLSDGRWLGFWTVKCDCRSTLLEQDVREISDMLSVQIPHLVYLKNMYGTLSRLNHILSAKFASGGDYHQMRESLAYSLIG